MGVTNRRNHASRREIPGDGAGTLISNQLLNQEAYLRRDIVNDNFSIQNTGDHLIVTLPQDFLFAIDSTSVRSDFMADSHTLSINLRS